MTQQLDFSSMGGGTIERTGLRIGRNFSHFRRTFSIAQQHTRVLRNSCSMPLETATAVVSVF